MKKFKLNNKGFMLVETLVVAVFAMAIFSIIYSNMFPIMAEYERREVFDDVDGKYGIYWIKKILQSNDVDFGDVTTSGTIAYHVNNTTTGDASVVDENSYFYQFDCNTDILYDESAKKLCNDLVKSLQIVKRDSSGNEVSPDDANYSTAKPCIYITTFNLKNFKGVANTYVDQGIFKNDLSDYISYLPMYDKIASLNRAKYRVIVEYHRTKDDNDYYAYSTIEVKK